MYLLLIKIKRFCVYIKIYGLGKILFCRSDDSSELKGVVMKEL